MTLRFRPRNVALEREITEEAARSAVDPAPLIEFAVGVDWLREARAEAADMRNYLCWLIEDHIGEPSAEDAKIALRFLALAYDRTLAES